MERTHASFFSGVRGLDLGLERAGWLTVSFSEIDPYASAVLAERWSEVPNLGDIVRLRLDAERSGADSEHESDLANREWHRAFLWTGGFPCQDLSVAGKRRGLAGERSGLAFAFLDLVERHRPPAILLENVPGLLSSNGGKDLGALLGRLGELGYWWAYRILDAQFFGVPQRRRRVFICALHAGAGFGADSAAAVLSVGARCGGHSAAGDEAGAGAASRPGYGVAHALTASHTRSGRYDANGETFAVGPSPDSSGVREADGLAGRLDDSQLVGFSENQRGELVEHDIAHQLTSGGGKPGQGYPAVYVKRARVNSPDSPESWSEGGVMPTLNSFDVGDIRTTAAVVGSGFVASSFTPDPDLLPIGLDSHRYRCCGNGVVSNVSEWIGIRLARALEEVAERAA